MPCEHRVRLQDVFVRKDSSGEVLVQGIDVTDRVALSRTP